MAAEAIETLTDYSKTQRIVLLLDLNPLLHVEDPKSYVKTLISSSTTLLSFPPLSSSLFSFKPLFSSLSPLLSSSRFPSVSLCLSFDHPDSTLHSLIQFLESFSKALNKSSFPLNPSKASNLAASLRQLVHDYAWDPIGTLFDCDSSDFIRSNLVILFSPVHRNLNGLSEFFDVGMEDECLKNTGAFVNKFGGVFGGVNEAFVSRDIHCCWVDVKLQTWETEASQNLEFGLLEGGIRSLGWGFCSTDSVVLGSALVPFGLIYPMIGVLSNCIHGFDFNSDSSRRMNAQLNLEILDANKKPLECKCAELEFVDLKLCSRSRDGDDLYTAEHSNSQRQGDDQKNRSFMEQNFDGITKICVRAVRSYNQCEKFEDRFLSPIMVRESLGKSQKQKDNISDFYADTVLQMLARDMGESSVRKHVPIWQIFLSFLYREGYWALISLSDDNGNLHTGILKPFTVHSAILCILDDSLCPNDKLQGHGKFVLSTYFAERFHETSKLNDGLKHSTGLDSQCHLLPSNKLAARKKKNKRNFLCDLTWSAFCEAAAEHLEIDIEESYLSRDCNNSKKLKFMKCWMKQVNKSNSCSLTIPGTARLDQEEIREPIEFPQDSDQLVSCSASVGEGSSRVLDETRIDFCSGTLENFFNSLPNKIEQGLESGEVELGAFAKRIVSSTIYWLYQKHESEDNAENQTFQVKANDACSSKVDFELIKLLLKEPKELAIKRRDLSSLASDSRSIGSASVREYELQILFRMEILQSEVGTMIEEPMKQKFVKQICSLLDSIQCYLEGGFFGDWRLDKYVEKVIKSRYHHSLEDVVDKIYTKMDLLFFDNEDELPNTLLNSEDSNHSLKQKPEKNVNFNNSGPDSIGDRYPQMQKFDAKNPQVIRTQEHARKIIEAQEKRERARRFSSFTSWMPDLQRVWAPKAVKSKFDHSQKQPKRKNSSRTTYDMVCETPLTQKMRSSPHGICTDDEEDHEDCRPHSHGHVSKALFQDDIQ